VDGGQDGVFLAFRATGNRDYYNNGDNAAFYLANGAAPVNAVFAIADRKAFKDGVLLSSSITAWVGSTLPQITIGKANGSSGVACVVTHFWIGSTTLSDTDVGTISTAMAAL
jgi:hypothetical protein